MINCLVDKNPSETVRIYYNSLIHVGYFRRLDPGSKGSVPLVNMSGVFRLYHSNDLKSAIAGFITHHPVGRFVEKGLARIQCPFHLFFDFLAFDLFRFQVML